MSSPNINPYGGLSPHRARDRVDNRCLVPEYPRRRAVAICGSRGVATMPWEDKSVSCWAINNFWNTARDGDNCIAASRWWEMHQITPDVHGPRSDPYKYKPDANGFRKGYHIQDHNDMEWIKTCPIPLYTTEPYPKNPNVVVWPIQYFAEKYRDYFTSTFSMQIAQAFDEGFSELQIHGLELLLGTKRECTVESACVNYWLGYVEGRGMKVVIVPNAKPRIPIGRIQPHDQFVLTHPFRYGHEYWNEADWVRGFVSHWDEKAVAV